MRFSEYWIGLHNGLRHYSGFEKVTLPLFFLRQHLRYERILTHAIKGKEIWVGPAYPEFGHVLLHLLPFLSYCRHKLEIRKFHICANEVYLPYFQTILGDDHLVFYPLKDRISSISPQSNRVPKASLDEESSQLFQRTKIHNCHFDLSDQKAYWNVFRNWTLAMGYQFLPIAEKPQARNEGINFVLFPRKKGASTTENNGGPWDYAEIAKMLSKCGSLTVAGHPDLSYTNGFADIPNLSFAWNNEEIIKATRKADLVITQHSGACILGDYFGVDTLIIFNGEPPIKGLEETYRFRRLIKKGKFYFAFSLLEIDGFLKNRFLTIE